MSLLAALGSGDVDPLCSGSVVSGSLAQRHWAVDPLSSACPTLVQADTDSIPAAQGTPPGSPWDHMRYSQESDSPIVR